MDELIRELYTRQISQSHIDFDHDPEYKEYYTQAEELWEGGEMPVSFFRLLERSDFLSFSCGLRLGVELGKWLRTG